jgi:hypothetical protein
MQPLPLTLREHTTQAFALTPQQAKELAGASPTYADVRLRTDGLYDVRAKGHVGTLVLPSVEVLLQPKMAIRDLFFLLSCSSPAASPHPEQTKTGRHLLLVSPSLTPNHQPDQPGRPGSWPASGYACQRSR